MIGNTATALVPVLLTERGRELTSWWATITRHVERTFTRRAYHRAWASSPHGRATQQRYRHSEHGRAKEKIWRRRYLNSPLGRHWERRYRRSAKGRAARYRYFTKIAHTDKKLRSYIDWTLRSVDRSESFTAEWVDLGAEYAAAPARPPLSPSAGLAASLILGAIDDIQGTSSPKPNPHEVAAAVRWLRNAAAPLTVEQCCDLIRLPYSALRRWCDATVLPPQAQPGACAPVALDALTTMFQYGGPL